MTLLTEYDEEASIRGWLRDGRQLQAVEDGIMVIRKYKASPEEAAKDMGAPLELVLEKLKEKTKA